MFKLRSLFVALFGFMFITSIALLFVSKYIDASESAKQSTQHQLAQLKQLVQEVKQVANQRSKFARSFVMTGELRWLDLFQLALAIDNGTFAKESEYQLGYWDTLSLPNSVVPKTDDKKVSASFFERFERFAPNDYEFNQLQRAFAMDEELVDMELQAISSRQEYRGSELVQSAVGSITNQENLLLGSAYLVRKEQAYQALADVELKLLSKLKERIAECEQSSLVAQKIHSIIILTLLLSIALSFYLLWRYYITPISNIQKVLVAQVEKNDFNFKLNETYQGELGTFARAMNRLLENITQQLNFSTIIKDFNLALRGKNSAHELGDEIIEFVCQRLSIPVVGLYVYEEDELERVSGIGYENEAKSTYQDSESVYFHALKTKNRYSIDLSEQFKFDHHGKAVFLRELHYFPLTVGESCIGLLELGSFYPLSEKEFHWLSYIIRDLAVGLQLTRNQEIQRKTERMAYEQLELNKKIIDAIPNPMYYRNQEGMYLGVNSRFHEFRGTFEADVIGAKPDNIFPFDIATRFNESEKKLLANPGHHNYEMRIKNVNGEEREVVVYEATFSDADNQVAGIVGLILDVTQSKEMERQLRDAKMQADSSSKAKGEFLANMSHEIRTPMNAIIGMSHLILNTQLSKQQMNYMKKIDLAANNLLGIINDVLDFSKIESGKMSIEHEPFDLDKVTTNVSIVNSIKAEDKGLELLLDIPPDVPSNLVGDPLRLGQVLINLCGNAIKFTEQGEVIITVRVVEQNDESAVLKFSVKDSGIGLTQAQQEQLFKAFSQADTSITRKYGGTGLGLSISKRLVELMGGQIGVTSEEGVGSEFFFTIKVGLQEVAVKPLLCPESIIKNTSVLVVDDNDAARAIMSDLIAHLGFKVSVASCGEEALEIMERETFQLVFSDWNMPNMDGCELAQRIAELKLTHSPKVILVTAHSRELNLEDNLINVLGGIITKPINASIVFDCVMDCFDLQSESIPKPKTKKPKQYSFAGTKALLVEDNETNQEVATEMLQSINIDVTIANHGAEALDKLEQNDTFSLIFMDMQMPVMDGLTAARKIRENEAFDTTPIIAMTANAMKEDVDQCLAVGMNAHIAKPINFDKMVATIDEQLKQKGRTILPKLADEASVVKGKNTDTNKPATDSFKIDGFDFKDGIDRIGGNEKAYWNILGKFVHKQVEELINLEQAVIIGDTEHAARIAHSLKGSAANLSAHYLMEKGEAFEDQIAQQASVDIEQLHEVISYLKDADEKLTNRELKPKQAEDELQSTMSQTKRKQLFDELLELVQNFDVQSLEVIDEMFEQNAFPQEILEQVRDTINDFEFAKAEKILITMSDLA